MMEVGYGSESYMVAGNPCQRDLKNMGRTGSRKGDEQGSCTSLGKKITNAEVRVSREVDTQPPGQE